MKSTNITTTLESIKKNGLSVYMYINTVSNKDHQLRKIYSINDDAITVKKTNGEICLINMHHIESVSINEADEATDKTLIM